MDPGPSSGAAEGRPLMTRGRARLEGVGNPGADRGIFLLDPNAPRGPRDIVIENEEETVKIEVKEEPSYEGGLEVEDEMGQENEPARKRVKVEDDDIMGEVVIVEDELDIPIDSLEVNGEEQGMQQATDGDDEIAHEFEESTSSNLADKVSPEVEDVVPPVVEVVVPPEVEDVVPPEVEDVVPPEVDHMSPSLSQLVAGVKQRQRLLKEMFKLQSLVEFLSIDGDHVTASPDTSGDEVPIASTSDSCQVGNEDVDRAQIKILQLFPEVIKVYWEKYAKFQPNSRDLLNLNCRRACKTWKEGMDKVLEGECTPLHNIHPTVIIPYGDVEKTVEVVSKVLEAYENVDLTACPFPPRVLEIQVQNTDSTVQQIVASRSAILAFIEKFGKGLKEFKYYGIIGDIICQYTSHTDWYLTFVGDWICRMPNLEKLTMRNSWDKGVHRLIEMTGVKLLSDDLDSHSIIPVKFPKLINLKSLEEDLMPYCVITAALLVNRHVTHVHSYKDCMNKCTNRWLQAVDFPLLRSISYVVDNVDTLFSSEPDRMKSIFKAVEKLELDNSKPCIVHMDLRWAFRFVQKCNQGKLKCLHFKFPMSISPPFLDKITRLAMPQLKELSITFFFENEQRQFRGFMWTEDNIIEMCSDLKSLEKLEIFNYRIDEIDWEENVRELKLCEIKKLVRTRLVTRLMGMLTNLKMVEIKPALGKDDEGVTVMKSLVFIRETSKE